MSQPTSSRRRSLESGAEPGAEKGFSLLEVMIAMGLLGISAYLLASMTTYTKKTERSTKTGSNRDNLYFQIANLAGNPVSIKRAYDMIHPSSVGELNYNPYVPYVEFGMQQCFPSCMGAVPIGFSACQGVGASNVSCRSHGGGTSSATGTAVWHAYSIVDSANSKVVAGLFVDSGGNRGEARYTMDGVRCDLHSLPNSMCPIVATAWFNPVCPKLYGSCNQASSIIIRYRVSWTTDTSVERQSAAFRELTGEVETYRKYVMGDVGPYLGSDPGAINTGTGSSTGTSSGGLSNTNTLTCTTDTDLSTMTDTALGYWFPYCG